MKQVVIIDGMKCDGCAQNVSERLSGIQGIERVLVDISSKNATIETEREITKAEYIDALVDTKYDVVEVN
ncbi:heavy-metal-associated domain-containing protein [Jeotgalibaca sp. MA1X17-3]|uniref:heavy-metal-associated domain-containing protein n=1 Tax=Jeotgalibaca sp. MA1X17-3 TaxID=2908211 RepID=UPI001F23CC5A|nr:heavy metal-associated domain-containing protein [Jeotgalibaca sp. MA1X17-3]UJF16397.1 heavy-metal-associated domain-containing protein [Jeotgalibaca sp. MA1X17-3]